MNKLRMFVIATIAMFVFVAMPAMAASTTYQVYDRGQDKLIVYSGDNANTAVVFTGRAEDYDGSAVSPSAVPSKYYEKRQAINMISSYEAQGRTTEAQALRVIWHLEK